ncbi:LysE family translocator [Granulosicoccus antarcticus]|uniref:Leucine efflux protein n=1 Tax=Granulosicoccus antarcticus IMCC3135 TaxID=1192854 RepID=A0A2Z2P6C3_9GAMM|nr:LysE family translocator [Granulosicoccus antarcticus]ASJ76257.1 Leucine efflux protein [Granulosicoccus antarcticus IMCC3135]
MINLADVAAYTMALGIAAAIPGPGITALVARSVGSGTRAGFALLTGIIVGDLLYLSFAVFGLAIIAQSFSTVFTFIRWASIAYLLYLAWQFWTAERHDMQSTETSRSDLGAALTSGLGITLGNPKTIAFYLALLPLVLDLNTVTVGNWAMVLVPATIAVLLTVGTVYILGALVVRRILAGSKAQRNLHRSAAVAMAGAAGTMILREL